MLLHLYHALKFQWLLKKSAIPGLGLFVALPLSLLRNIESLSDVVSASILFYLCVLVFIVMNSWSSLIDGSWISLVNFWRVQGVLQCLPIFCMALSCQA